MKRKIGLVVFVLVLATPAFAQIRINLWGNPVERWQNDMSYMIDSALWSHPYRRGVYCWHDSYWGIHRGGLFYLTHDNMGRPLSRTQKTAVGAAIGAGLGGGISQDLRGTAIGAGVGALVGYLTGTNDRPQPRVIGQQQQVEQESIFDSAARRGQYMSRLVAAALEDERRRDPVGFRARYPEYSEQRRVKTSPSVNEITERFDLLNGTDAPIVVNNLGVQICQLAPNEVFKLIAPLGKINLEAWAVVYNVNDGKNGQSLVAKRVPLEIEVSGRLVKFVFP